MPIYGGAVLAQSDAGAVGAVAVAVGMLFIFFMVIIVSVAISIVICYLLWNAQKQVPARFRKVEPNHIWLLLIPLFNLVWNFFVIPKISDSYKAYFDSVGRTDVGTCNREIGLGYCIAAACSFVGVIPIIGILGSLAGLAALVLLILFLIKTYELKKQIVPEAPRVAPVAPPPPAQ